MDDPKSSLLFKGVAVLKPAFKFVAVGTDEIKSNHGSEFPPRANRK
jgi:hypothetical protein